MACVAADARQQVPLLGRAEDHDLAAQVGAEPGQLAEVLGRARGGRRRRGWSGRSPSVLASSQCRPMTSRPAALGLAADLGPLAAA